MFVWLKLVFVSFQLYRGDVSLQIDRLLNNFHLSNVEDSVPLYREEIIVVVIFVVVVVAGGEGN